jgi:hypothetical protein
VAQGEAGCGRNVVEIRRVKVNAKVVCNVQGMHDGGVGWEILVVQGCNKDTPGL